MLESISWSDYFLFILAALIIYYAFVFFFYYNKELASRFSSGSKRKDNTLIQPINGIPDNQVTPTAQILPINNIDALPLKVPSNEQQLISEIRILQTEEQPEQIHAVTENVSAEDLEILSEVQAESLDVDLEEEFMPFEDPELEVNDGGLLIEEVIETVDLVADAVAIESSNGILEEKAEEELIDKVSNLEENDFWGSLMNENPELNKGLEDIKKRVYERHGLSFHENEKFDLEDIKEKSAKASLLDENKIDDLVNNWQA
ncbi:hypothetical protein WG906_18285 [Pedobacter sp. P351]|uniref:hypothetical protein n=1 Tax=Pedobacter superstes TaxID=3133441 RepID=UPI0030B56C0D